MSISIRDSIRWFPDAASEPTSTVVLTSPEHRFVDVRVLKDGGDQGTSLDWAFAGISSSETRNGVRHSTWRHVVDSRMRAPETVIDEGDIFPQDDGRTLETGRMVNPATGKLTSYEEVWTDLETEGIPEVNPGSDTTTQQARGRCVVLELNDAECEARGMAICLGRYHQCVVRMGDRFTAERWLWEDGEWKRKCQAGVILVPGPEHMSSATLSLGDEVKLTETSRWRVVEIN
ncbi:hypothetical protein EV127DRAFT_69306 [Xylaria flabelliformis]|nr:hypothetical protein EV127DRAFT_69306 [Xylaria flabelliformis]